MRLNGPNALIRLEAKQVLRVFYGLLPNTIFFPPFSFKANPPKTIEFVHVYIVELVDRPQKPLCAVEPYISGSYRKHNNNFGFVNEDERNTPQAFSHFTYEASNHTVLICDIQGVEDMYTGSKS